MAMTQLVAGVTADGEKYFTVPKPQVDIRYLTDSDDKLMNRLIFDGHALVLEKDVFESSDDSYCGCNCGCCFNL